MMARTGTNQSAQKVLRVLTVLMRHFAHGLTPGEIAKATGLSASNITRYVATLEEEGYAERIQDTGRVRASHRVAQQAVAIMRSLNDAKDRAEESISRITKQL
jgi:DNA-binding IclR family transcriptional regulator